MSYQYVPIVTEAYTAHCALLHNADFEVCSELACRLAMHIELAAQQLAEADRAGRQTYPTREGMNPVERLMADAEE